MVNTGLVESRSKAQSLILAGQIRVDSKRITKVGTLVAPTAKIEIVQNQKFVSRGGDKLAGALEDFKISPQGQICLDVGSSTGGFTDCLLQNGAQHVFAVDVGRAQLVSKLVSHPQVTSIEKTHILNLDKDLLKPLPSWAVIDVSFISLKKVLPKVKMLLPSGAVVVALLKPQFEVGPKHLKKGVVRSEELNNKVLEEMVRFAENNFFTVLATTPSKLKGPKGNQEIFMHMKVN